MNVRILIVSLLLCTSLPLTARTQGRVRFTNKSSIPSVNAPILEPDGIARAAPGSIYVQLYAGLDPGSLTPVGVAVPILGLGPDHSVGGYYDGGVVVLPNPLSGPKVWVRVWAWDVQAAGYSDAVARGLRYGKSNPIPITPATPPMLPVYLIGLDPTVLVPEPSPRALGLLGLALFWVAGKRRSRAAGGVGSSG